MTIPMIFETCRPRSDILTGSIADADFAADLAQVIRGHASEEYGAPVRFFAWTWPTRGLKNRRQAAIRASLVCRGARRTRRAPSGSDAVRRWYRQDWMMLDPKLRSNIIEALSVFLSVFDVSDVAAVFCPPRRVKDAPDAPSAGADTAAVARQLPLDEVIDAGGVMLKQAWLQTLLRRPAARRLAREWRPAVFLCDEYQSFVTVGAGDEMTFEPTRQLSGHRAALRRQAGRRQPALLPQAGLPAAEPSVLARPRGRKARFVQLLPDRLTRLPDWPCSPRVEAHREFSHRTATIRGHLLPEESQHDGTHREGCR